MTQKTSKNINGFNCLKCNFNCSKLGDFKRHNLTAKHKIMTNNDDNTSKNILTYNCNCGKTYKYRQGLHNHKQKCNENIGSVYDCDYKTMFLDAMSQNNKIMELLREQSNTIQQLVPKIGNNNNTITTNNTKFNLNVFLNEDCKDAINFSEFIKSIQVSVEDLENQSQLGYVNGITKVFLDNIRKLSINERPVHCTDKKRNTLYVKEDDEWSKEGSHDILKKGIQEITSKTHGTLIQMKRDNAEEYADGDSDFSNKCISIQRNLTPSYPRETSIGKIVGNISDNTILMKSEEENLRKLI
jgi:hypothetical protein